MRRLVASFLLALAACGPSDRDPGPGGVTVGEARALDEAAEMLEKRRMPPEVLRPAASEAPKPPLSKPPVSKPPVAAAPHP